MQKLKLFKRWKLERLIKAIKIIDTYRDFVLYNDKLDALNSCLNGIAIAIAMAKVKAFVV